MLAADDPLAEFLTHDQRCSPSGPPPRCRASSSPTRTRPPSARICAKVEGLPLAIELAAARLRAMSPEQILERLDDRYALLTRGSRGAPTRQQTLSWSVGWSYDLCTPAEQQLWARLSVFAGSFELQAAEDICNGDFAPEDIVDLLSALVDKSILTRTESEGAVRFRLLETLRDYGRQRIEQTDGIHRAAAAARGLVPAVGERRRGRLVRSAAGGLDEAAGARRG